MAPPFVHGLCQQLDRASEWSVGMAGSYLTTVSRLASRANKREKSTRSAKPTPDIALSMRLAMDGWRRVAVASRSPIY
jgi:hypothetical protein